MWLGAARTLLKDAENYAEIEMEFSPAGGVERYAFTAQRVGELTPHQARKAAEVRAEAAEARLAEIAAHVRERLNAPGRAGMSRMAAGIILGIAEGSEGETGNHA